MKILLRVLAGIFVLGVAVVVAGVAIVLSIDPNEYRDRVTAEVKTATGRDLVIKGDLSIGISLVPTIVANDVAFSNAAWGSRPQMATIKRLEAALEIVPALSGEIRIGRIVLVEPDILLEVASDGRANWDFSRPSAKVDAAPPQSSAPSAAGGPPTLPTVEAVSIDKARLRFNDMKAKTDMALLLDRVRIDRASGGLGVDVAGAYNNVSFAVKGKTDLLDGLAADDKFGFDLAATALQADLKLKGALTKPLSAPRVAVDFALSGKDIVATLDAARTLAPQLADVTVPPLGSYDIAGRAIGPVAAPSVDNLKFNVGSTDMLKLAGSGKASKTAVSLDKLSAQVYGSDVQGSVIAEIGGKVPDVKANLTSRLIDVADFEKLAAAFEGKAETKSTPATKGSPAPSSAGATNRGDGRVFPNDPLPLEGLKAANATVSFKGAKLVAKDTTVESIDVIAKLNGGKLLLDPMAAMIAGGRVAGKTTLDASAATPALDANLSVDKLDLGGLLKDRGVTDMLTGKISTKIDARARGNSVRAMMAGLNGETEVVMDEGVIASRYVDLLAADLTKQLIPGGGGNAKINCFVSRFDVKQGMATSKALLFDTEKMTVSGGGTVNLRDETLDMGLEPQPKEKSLVSLAVPLKIGGTLASPSVAPSTTSLLKGIAGLAITGLTPAGILLNLASTGTGDKNPCVVALNRAPQKGEAPAQGQGTSGQKAPAQESGPIPNPLNTLRNLFGGGK